MAAEPAKSGEGAGGLDAAFESVEDDILTDEIKTMSVDGLNMRVRMLENEIRVMRSEVNRITHENNAQAEKIKDNKEKIKLNKQLPYLVANVSEILDLEPTQDELEEADLEGIPYKPQKTMVVKTSTRQTIFLPLPGLVPTDQLKPGDLIGVNKDSYLCLETLPPEYDSRVKAMEVDESPEDQYAF